MEVDDVAGHQDEEWGLWSLLREGHDYLWLRRVAASLERQSPALVIRGGSGAGTAARPVHLCGSRPCLDGAGSPAT